MSVKSANPVLPRKSIAALDRLLMVPDVGAALQANRVLAQVVEDRIYQISSVMLQRAVRRPEINVGLELLALAFAERFAASLKTDSWVPLLSWIETTCEKYGHMTVIARLMSVGMASVTSVTSDLGTSLTKHADLRNVGEQIESIVAQPRVSRTLIASDTLDEIDVVLGELVGRLEASDAATAEHSRAVSLWCARISKRMALSQSESVFITRCGLIHDIGKMTTPPDILKAPRRLSASETNVMRRHAEDGAAIVSAIPLLASHTPAVRGHHERLDGHGYPDGLAAASIPLAARIVAVADSFNAMIGNRPYRLPMRPTAALEELRRHAGSQFDPDVIDAMNDVLSKRS